MYQKQISDVFNQIEESTLKNNDLYSPIDEEFNDELLSAIDIDQYKQEYLDDLKSLQFNDSHFSIQNQSFKDKTIAKTDTRNFQNAFDNFIYQENFISIFKTDNLQNQSTNRERMKPPRYDPFNMNLVSRNKRQIFQYDDKLKDIQELKYILQNKNIE